MKITTAQEMQALDQKTITEYGIPSLILMENAAFGIVGELLRLYPSLVSLRIIVLCGKGNNGGDGLAVARHLLRRGVTVEVVLLDDSVQLKRDAKTNWEIFQKLNGVIHQISQTADMSSLQQILVRADLLVDAILGTGLSQSLSSHLSKVVDEINRAKKPVVSIDIASGISSDTGKVLGSAVRAERTITLALPKRGHFLSPGLEHRGDLSVVDIGIPAHLIEEAKISAELLTADRLRSLLSPRPRDAHKGTFGHLLILAGSRGKAGAASMASWGALRSGLGLLTVASPNGISPPNLPMEAMTAPLPETTEGTVSKTALKSLMEILRGKGAVAVGPGLSQNSETQHVVQELIIGLPLPIVVDADGINALVGKTEILKTAAGPRILTPHPGEMARLIGIPISTLLEDRIEIAKRFAMEHQIVLVLKGAHSVAAFPDGILMVNSTGNPGMATGGSGDVLTGMIGAYLAQGRIPSEAVILSVYLHGLAGDLATAKLGEIGMTPTDLINQIPHAIQSLQHTVLPELRESEQHSKAKERA